MLSLNSFKRILSVFLITFFILHLNACIGDNRKDRLKFPAIVAIDQAKNRVFVIDNQKNGLNLIDASDGNDVLTRDDSEGNEGGLLTENDALLLPTFPSNAAVASLENDLSRLFIIGSDEAPLQKIIVLDYDATSGLRRSELSPINVPGQASDVLVGIQVDEKRGIIWVTNSSSGFLHGYDVKTGEAIAGSPVALPGVPTRLSIDANQDLMAVANSGSNEISLVDLQDLNQPVQTFDIGRRSRDIALQSNNQGTLLFVSVLNDNRSQVYRLNLNDLSQSSLINEVIPTPPSQEDTEVLTGNLNLVAAGILSDGRIGGYFTQSSGDLLAVRVAADFGAVEAQRVEIGAASGEAIEALVNMNGQVVDLYFASPGVGTLTVVDPFETELSDQIP